VSFPEQSLEPCQSRPKPVAYLDVLEWKLKKKKRKGKPYFSGYSDSEYYI
jgi:hypothetical protein